MPILQCLGKALLDGGAAAEAEAVYRNDLRVYPENGWGLTGLAQAMEAQGKPAADVAAVRARLAEAWSAADVPLPPSSCAAFEFDVPLYKIIYKFITYTRSCAQIFISILRVACALTRKLTRVTYIHARA